MSAPNVALLPPELRAARAWLVWRFVPNADPSKKPLKVPFYLSGAPRGWPNGRPSDGIATESQPRVPNGHPLDIAALGSLADAVRVCQERGLSGVGLAMRADLGLVALDFDDRLGPGGLDPRVQALVLGGTYAEVSPSGRGLRVFYRGSLPDAKDLKAEPKVEVFCAQGYVTITSNALPGVREWCQSWGDSYIADLPDAVRAMHRERMTSAAPTFGQGFFASSGVSGVGGALGGDVSSVGARHGAGAADGFFGNAGVAGGAAGGVAPGGVSTALMDLSLLSMSTKVGWSIDDARDVLRGLDPAADRQVWLNALMALHHEFDGSDAALDLADEWSSGRLSGIPVANYVDRRDIETRWRSFGRRQGGNPITARWLLKWKAETGVENRRGLLDEVKGLLAESTDSTDLTTRVAKKLKAMMPDDTATRAEIVALFAKRFRSIAGAAADQ